MQSALQNGGENERRRNIQATDETLDAERDTSVGGKWSRRVPGVDRQNAGVGTVLLFVPALNGRKYK